MRIVLATFILVTTFAVLPAAAATEWDPAIPGVPPGGFATITVDGLRHGQRHVAPQLRLRVRSSKEYTAIVVRLDGKYVALTGRPVATDKREESPQWEFVETRVYEVELQDLVPGVHHLEIRRGIAGSSLPLVNEQDLWFSVGE